jgi:hypothetical protein
MGLFSEKECEKFIHEFLKWPIRHKVQLCSLLEVFTQSKYYFLGEIACEGKLSNKRKTELVEKMILRLDAGDPLHFPKVCRILSLLEPGSEIIFKKILLALEKKSHYNRREGLTIYAVASIAHNSNIIELMKEQLYHGDSYVRGAAIMFFGQAQHFDRQIIDRAIELASIEKAYNSIDTQNMMVSLAQVSPESCIPYIESWKKKEKEKYRGTEYDIWCSFMEYYSGQILNVPQYKEQEYEGRILRYLDKTHVDVESRANLARAIGKSGIRSDGVIPTLIQMTRNDDEISASCLMTFRDSFIVRPEITEQAIRLLESEILYNRIRAMNYLSQIQHITKVMYNGKEVELTTMVEDLFFKYKDEQHSSFLGYAIEYMGKANHKNSKLEDTILKAALSQRSEVLSDIETLIRYLVNVNHFSPTFIGLLLSYQRITEHLDMSCYVANSFFENIERHIPQEKHKFMKTVLRNFCFENIAIIWKLRKYLLSNDSDDMWADQQAERLYRTGLALQKIVLCEDEAKKRIGIS